MPRNCSSGWVLREGGGLAARMMDFGHLAHRLRVGGDVRGEDLAVAVDDGEQVVEIVRHAAGELADRLHLGGLGDLPLEPGFLAGVGQPEQYRRLAQPAYPGQA